MCVRGGETGRHEYVCGRRVGTSVRACDKFFLKPVILSQQTGSIISCSSY